jgi:hypothetical protein
VGRAATSAWAAARRRHFDRHVEERGIPEQDYPAAFALRIAEITSRPVPRFEEADEPEGE